jgi:hypothetical protein
LSLLCSAFLESCFSVLFWESIDGDGFVKTSSEQPRRFSNTIVVLVGWFIASLAGNERMDEQAVCLRVWRSDFGHQDANGPVFNQNGAFCARNFHTEPAVLCQDRLGTIVGNMTGRFMSVGLNQEFGTAGNITAIKVLRAENALHQADPSAAITEQERVDSKEFFCPSSR